MKTLLIILAITSSFIATTVHADFGWDFGIHFEASTAPRNSNLGGMDLGFGNDYIRAEVGLPGNAAIKVGAPFGKFRGYVGYGILTSSYTSTVDVTGVDVPTTSNDNTASQVFAELQYEINKENDFAYIRYGQTSGSVSYYAQRWNGTGWDSATRTDEVSDSVVWIGLRHYF